MAVAATPPIRVQRVAGVVADALRARILGADMVDGDLLPKEDTLRAEFGVGKPAIRESFRILEAEGLLQVVRGNRGGAIVHKPTTTNTAYTIGLALAAKGIHGSDVGAAVREIEPLCAAACAKRTDRATHVCPELRTLVERARTSTDPIETSELARQFHEELVSRCGNETLSLLVGALEQLWSSHVATASAHARQHGNPQPHSDQTRSINEHEHIIDLIEQGDHDRTRDAVTAHLERVQRHGTTAASSTPIELETLRSRLQP